MGILQVKKVVAVCFLEATKMMLEHLGEHRLALSNQSMERSAEVTRFYGEARRLRDYLQRCVSAFPDLVDLDFSDADKALLIACCRRSVEAIDLRTGPDQATAHDERQWLQKKRMVLTDWAVAIAEKPPLLELPLPRLSPIPTEGTKALTSRLQQKLFRGGHQHTLVVEGSPALSQTQGVPGPVNGPLLVEDYEPALSLDAAEKVAVAARSVAKASVEREAAVSPLLESQKLRDPRLRTLVVMDLRSYERSVAAQDYRLAAVLLASILEAAVLDHAIPRRAELGLTSTPDTWNPQDVLVRVLGEAFPPKDKSLAYHLFSARNLLRPSLQIVTPTVVTHASLERLHDFVQRALHAMGFASARTDPLDKVPMLRPDGRLNSQLNGPFLPE